jgi:hypothetical protein
MTTTKKLKWKYIGKVNADWIGMLPEEFPPIRFVLKKVANNKHLIRCNLDGIKNQECEGLQNAKEQAQKLFNSYAESLLN